MRALTNKAQVVLGLLREGGEWTCQEISDEIQSRTPCRRCEGACEVDGRRCDACYGRGCTFFSYSTAYTALKQLMARRLVSRRYVLDEWGDVTTRHVYAAVSVPEDASADELERLWAAPAYDGGDGADA